MDLADQHGARVGFFSDLQNNQPVQVGGTLRSNSLVIVQPCDSDLTTCQGYYASFTGLAKGMGVATISTADPTNSHQAVAAWLGR